jgi:hypothetical protein
MTAERGTLFSLMLVHPMLFNPMLLNLMPHLEVSS